MSSSRYSDSRYQRERSPYRDRRSSTYSSGYPPRGSDSTSRSNTDSSAFPPRDVPRGPKSLVDAPRGPTSGPPSGVPSGPRDGRGRGFAGRGDGAPSLRDAPPLSTTTHSSRDHNTRDHWRADRDRDRDRDRDFRDRRVSPSRRSPIRDSRDPRDPRDPRDSRDFSLNIDRARRNSRDGPPSAGSTYSDPPLASGSSYRGSGIGRGRGTGRDFNGDFRSRGRAYHNDDRDRHHDPRDARDARDRMYRPRSRSRDPVRRDRDIRDDRDFDRRDRDDRRFDRDRRDDEPRRYDSYIGSASLKPSVRPLDTHRGSTASDSRNIPGTPTGPSTPHSTHHSATGDRSAASVDPYSRRSSIATEPLSSKDARRESDRNDLIASRAEFSKERYAPRASSPPAAVPAFGFSNVWRNPALDAKPAPTAQAQAQKAVAPTPSGSAPAPAAVTPIASTVPKPAIPSGLSTAPPTGPKADRPPDRPQADAQPQDSKPAVVEQPRPDPPLRSVPTSSGPSYAPNSENVEPKLSTSAPSQANSPPLGPASRNRPPPTGPQAPLRPNASPSFSRPQPPPYVARDASPGAIPSGPRNPLSNTTSPKSAPINIPTGPKADRANPMAPRPPMYGPPDRAPFTGPRMPLGGPPKSMQWVRPGLNRQPTIPSKREFPNDDRERTFGTTPKAPKLEGSLSATESQRPEQLKSDFTSGARQPIDTVESKDQILEDQPQASSPKPVTTTAAATTTITTTRRLSDVSMPDVSPSTEKPPMSATSSAPQVMDDSDDDLDLDEDDFVESEAKYNREKALLESKRVDLSAAHLRVTSLLQEITLLSSITTEHLPRQQSRPVDEEMASPLPIQPQPESITTELPTPKAEEPEDVVMEEKQEISMAPATRALRLRWENSDEREITPSDLSTLPYLGSGPPTPLSDPDQERPSVPESVMLAIRDNLQKNIAPERDPGDIMTQYAAAYREWRLKVRELDYERDQDDHERQPSAEPGLKVTTPDVQSSAMAALLEVPHTIGRRGHSSRNASEFDIEQVIKESLKTAEEERMGKKDKEPKKSIWDPEREAVVPLELTAYEAQRRRFIDTNFQREPGQGIFVYHYEPPEDDFTEEEHRIMVQHYRDQYAKKWGKLAEILYKEAGTDRTYKDTINHYYATKWGKEYKHKAKRRGGPRRRGGGVGRGRGGAANVDRSEAPEDGLTPLPLTDSGRPRRLAAPTFGAESEFDSATAVPTPGRQRRQTDADGTQEKVGRRGKLGKEKGGRKPKNQLLAAAPAGSPIKVDKKERALGVKTEEDFGKRHMGDMPASLPPGLMDDQFGIQSDTSVHTTMSSGPTERPRSHTNSRPGPSSYWSVTEQEDFTKNVAHFGTDWAAIANHMGTKTQTMVKNYFARMIEKNISPDLAKIASEADKKRERGEELGPPPTPTPAPKRRYESSQTTLPRTLAPTPEVAELLKSPPGQPIVPPKFSPPHPASRFPSIAQAAPQAKPIVPATGSTSISEASLAAIPSLPQQSPPAQSSRAQPQHSHAPHKPHHNGPKAGYFTDPPRMDSRGSAPPSSLAQSRPIQQQIQPQNRGQEPGQTPHFLTTIQSERDTQSRLEADHDARAGLAQHSRRISQELPYHRSPFQPTAPGAGSIVPSIRSTSGAGSPESRPLSLQTPRHHPNTQAGVQPLPEAASQPIPPSFGSRSSMGTPPVKEEQRHYPLPHAQHSQPPPQSQAQAPTYPQPPQPATQPSAPPPASKPAEPRKSNLLSLLNDTEPEEPRRKKPSDVPSHTPTPQQQTPIAPPPPVSQALPQRRDQYGDVGSVQSPYPRPYGQPVPPPQASSSRQIVDLTNEQPGARSLPRESWQQRQTIYPGQSQAQPAPSLASSHGALTQPHFADSRILGNHRSLLAQHNTPRHNPSPPPISAYNNSPHLHSRTPSLSGPSQQPRHGLSSSTPAPNSQSQAGASQILQPNPYATVDPPGPNSVLSAPVGMRPSPHHGGHMSQQRDMQARNEQSQVHNANLPYSNPQTPSDLHPAHQHLRGASITEQYRRDPRDLHHDFDARNHERDVSRELSQHADVLMREHRDSLLSRTGAAQDPRYPGPPRIEDQRYPVQRSHTPLSRTDHTPHPSLQHPPPHSLLQENSRSAYAPRQEEPRYRDPFPHRDNRLTDHIREEQAHQARMRGNDDFLSSREREMREREMRERDVRYGGDIMRRDGRLPGPPPGGPPHSQQEQRPGLPDWASVARNNEQWRR